MNPTELFLAVHNRSTRQQQHTEEKMLAMRKVQDAYNARTATLQTKLPALCEALAKQGLEVSEVSFRKSGRTEEVWAEEDKLNVSITVVPFNGKTKWLVFRGYTQDGCSKQDAARHRKGIEMAAYLTQAVGVDVQVNDCCFELREEENPKRLLINFWL
jgi:hypothetical protein